MLIITRGVGQCIYIGQYAEIEIKVLGHTKHGIKIGINAPTTIPIFRGELSNNQHAIDQITAKHSRQEFIL